VADTAGLILRANTASPELKAALSEVLAGLQGASVDPSTSDPVGRPAWSVGYTQNGSTQTWWFDPQNDQPLAIGRDDAYVTIYETAGVVDGTGLTRPNPAFIPATTEGPPGAKA
jgi:hypothetical protein